ncbi:MAG: hypothetical protein EA360_09480, partial [Balneolaceae bacterium]
ALIFCLLLHQGKSKKDRISVIHPLIIKAKVRRKTFYHPSHLSSNQKYQRIKIEICAINITPAE